MRMKLWYIVLLLSLPALLQAQVKINEVLYATSGDQIELKNFGTTAVDVSGWWFCSRFIYTQLNSMTLMSGSLNIPPGGIVALSGKSLDDTSADLGLYNSATFASTSAMEDFVQWGAAGLGRESVAVSKGIWTAGDFIATVAAGHSIEYDGDGDASSDWVDQATPTIGAENGILTSVEDEVASVPDKFQLKQNYPNPFNPETTIRYTLSEPAKVTLKVYNLLGQKVATLVQGVQPAGEHRVAFDGRGLASGLYVYRLKSGGISQTKIMSLLK